MKTTVLLSMSSLPPALRENRFIFNGDNNFPKAVIEGCISQLEPISRLIIQNSEDCHLIVLCTDQVYEVSPAAGMNSVDYYLKRLKDTGLCASDERIGRETTDYGCTYTLTDDCRSIRISEIAMHENHTLDSISAAISIIRDVCNTETQTAFYVIANGGLRDNYLTISSILSLLKYDGITPKGIYSSMLYGRGEGEIIDSMPSFRMFEFVSGMNEFVQFGSANTLKNYFAQAYKDSEDNPLIMAMNQISSGISFCNADLYAEGLTELRRIMKKDSPEFAVISQSPELAMFENVIRNDYGKLIEGEEFLYLDIVDRCVKKGLLQQAMTFLEAKVPQDFYSKGVLFFQFNEKARIIDETCISKTNAGDYLVYSVLKSPTVYELDPIHFVFQNFMYEKQLTVDSNLLLDNLDSYKLAGQYASDKTVSYEDMMERLKTLPNLDSLRNENKVIVHSTNYADQYKHIGEKGPQPQLIERGINLYTGLPSDEEGMKYRILTCMIIQMHSVLKTWRNSFNHGSGENSKSVADLREVLKTYVALCNALFAYADHNRTVSPDMNCKTVLNRFASLKGKRQKNFGYYDNLGKKQDGK